ncbi:hypothetical protein DKX38_019006 [Salix brachista]|uniref:Uncharacterized protein n=1 Tax=Salix brachista TaxID=2182728 RepID=A0A5N5KQA7_9ROSI|nr:hypothetical protein DKX38_019006 [Salix brachista]
MNGHEWKMALRDEEVQRLTNQLTMKDQEFRRLKMIIKELEKRLEKRVLLEQGLQCGAMTNVAKPCVERPRKVCAKWS